MHLAHEELRRELKRWVVPMIDDIKARIDVLMSRMQTLRGYL